MTIGITHISMGMREDLKIPITMLNLSFLNKLPFLGSYSGKRFKFEKCVEDDSKTILRVYVWDDKFSFENTDSKLMRIKDFEYSDYGINKGIEFVESTI